MTRTEAHTILDAARRGEFMTAAVITEALHATGDLERYEPEPVTYTSPQWPRMALPHDRMPYVDTE